MEDQRIYEDIAERTGGDIYIGVVGPVRTGKSTFIRRFAEKMILPHMAESSARAQLVDELPQAAEGKTVMTSEPKFIPAEAARVSVAENAAVNVRLVDCVGFPVEGAILGEDGKPRMVSTPWRDEPMPFAEAAQLGTQKVIREHATIGLLVTTDGSVADLPRERYLLAEERAVKELKEIGKPFVVLVNSRNAANSECEKLCASLCEKYAVPVLPFDCEKASEGDFSGVLETVLFEFPVLSIDFDLPDWVRTLPETDPIVLDALEKIRTVSAGIFKMRDLDAVGHMFDGSEYFAPPQGGRLQLGCGRAEYDVETKEGLFNRVLSRECGADVSDDFRLMVYVRSLGRAKAFYDRFEGALRAADETGYGIVMPDGDSLELEPPRLAGQGGRSGITLRASAGTYHVIRVDVKSEVSPVIGDAARSEEIARGMVESYERDPDGLWNTELFGRTFKDMVREDLESRAGSMPEEVRKKMGRTIRRIVNEGRGGVICILL